MKNLLFILCLLMAAPTFAQRNIKNLYERQGKIGIGTRTPDEMLTVKGKIHTQEVLVDLKGAVAPDYVFQNYFLGTSELMPGYTFTPLNKLAAYVEENHHLPGVPSAKELDAEGMSLKEMNLILLQKIEELTLYTIEQQKEIDSLKEIVARLQE